MSSDWSKYLARGVPVAPGGMISWNFGSVRTETVAEEIPVRQDLRDLSKEQKYPSYLEGLKKFQHVSAEDPLSYFQIAGT